MPSSKHAFLAALAPRQPDRSRLFQAQQKVVRRKLLATPFGCRHSYRSHSVRAIKLRPREAASARIPRGNRRPHLRHVSGSQITGAAAKKGSDPLGSPR